MPLRERGHICLSHTMVVVALSLWTCLPGCLSTRTDSPAVESLDSLGISIRGIRESNLRLAYREGLTVERAADSIFALATERETKVNACLWKIYCIPVIRQTYAESDPLLSAIDALAFNMQCKEYFMSGLGKDRFGPYQQIAIEAVSLNERRLLDLTRQRLSTATFDATVGGLSQWVGNHPLTNHVFERPSVLNDLGELLDRQDYTIGTAVGRIADDVDDLSSRLSLLSAQLPREARWQGEYLLTDLRLRERLEQLDSTSAVLTAALTSIDQGLTSGGLRVNLNGLEALRTDLQHAISQVSAERVVVMGDIERIRLATLAAAEEAANRSVTRWLEQAEAIVDRTLWKVGILVVLLFGATATLTFFLRRRLRP